MKQKKCVIHPWTSSWFLLLYSAKPRKQVRILTYQNWSIIIVIIIIIIIVIIIIIIIIIIIVDSWGSLERTIRASYPHKTGLLLVDLPAPFSSFWKAKQIYCPIYFFMKTR